MTVEIPRKLYFRIGEVAELAGVKPHVLRYWESEVGSIRPTKSKTNQRLYRRKDVELILRLRTLLYEQGFTLAGARRKLREAKVEAQPEPVVAEQEQMFLPLGNSADTRLLRELRDALISLRQRLKDQST